MAALQPTELLALLLEGNTLTPDELDQFIQEHRDEGELFDYKNGAITKNRKDGRRIIRKWISGFANSVGGVLIIGVDEPLDPHEPRKITPCERRIGRQSLIEWADHCLQDMVGYFSPPPRIQPIEHKRGLVLTIAVARAPSYIPCEEDGELKYFLRIGASTVAAPTYLIADLLLGRRQHPILDVGVPQIEAQNCDFIDPRIGDRTDARSLSFRFRVENLSLITAEEVAMGVIAWSLVEGETGELNNHLRLYLDISDLPFSTRTASKVIHCSSLSNGPAYRIAPFHSEELPDIRTFILDRGIPLKVSCAVYVLAKGAPPTWFQLEFRSLPRGIPKENTSPYFKPLITRKGSERPKVAWEVVSWRP